MVDLALPELWLPPKPAIIRPARDIVPASFLPGMFPGVASSIVPVEVNYTDTAFRTGDGTWDAGTRSFGSGVSATKRVIVAAFSVGNSGAVASVSIGGGAATLLVGSLVSNAVTLWGVTLNATSGNVTVTRSGTINRVGIIVWEVLYSASLTPHHTDDDLNTSTASLSLSLNIPSKGAALAGFRGNSASNTISLSAGLTARVTQNTFDNANNAYTGGNDGNMSAQTGRTITATLSPSGNIGGAAASWAPVS